MGTLLRAAPVGHLLVRLARTHRQWVRDALAELGLHVGQELVLAQLCEREGVRQTALAHSLAVELPIVHRTLARLQAAGFVELRRDESDARASCAFLTPRGRATCERIGEIWADADRRLSAALGPHDEAELKRLLGTVLDRVEATSGA